MPTDRLNEPTRLLDAVVPGEKGWTATSVLSNHKFDIRGMVLLPGKNIIPVIVVPGMMGTNLRAKRHARSEQEKNAVLASGQEAWSPPNWGVSGLWDSFVWERLSPRRRQLLFDAASLEVDDSGPINIPYGQDGVPIYPPQKRSARQRGWGEVHAGSYGKLLQTLQSCLNQTYFRDARERLCLQPHWKKIVETDPAQWGAQTLERLREGELEHSAKFHFPVYACGYNWLASCKDSSERLEQRILHIVDFWRQRGFACEKVILVTHSMGGLVARACAKRIPSKIAGVIHGAMPALGAPVAYRRMACGTEAPGSAWTPDGFEAWRTAKILGETTYDTTPVLAVSAGAMELLPNHRYPQHWLQAHVQGQAYGGDQGRQPPMACFRLPNEMQPDPYALYRDMRSWYRLVDPALADPARKYAQSEGGVEKAIRSAINAAEYFHRQLLDDYYHPGTFVFYGRDDEQRSFSQVHWVGHKIVKSSTLLTPGNIEQAEPSGTDKRGNRLAKVGASCLMRFTAQAPDASGDGTVPYQSGAAPAGKVKGVYEMRGFDHQFAYNNPAVLALTLRLVVKISQEIRSHEAVRSR